MCSTYWCSPIMVQSVPLYSASASDFPSLLFARIIVVIGNSSYVCSRRGCGSSHHHCHQCGSPYVFKYLCSNHMLNYLAITPSLRQRKNNHYLKSKYRILRSFLDLGVVSSGHLLHNPNTMDPYYGNLQQILKKEPRCG